ncbi:MAG: DUF3742 family protein [Proteobacteria bacterium]|nr:DUF3742 family protein [Pseudomonadota bacterium]
MATTTKHLPVAKLTRLVRWFGETWARAEHKATCVLVARGATPQAAKAVAWAVKLVLIGVLLFVAFWLALAVGILFIASPGGEKRVFDDSDDADDALRAFPHWKHGCEGYGMYDAFGWRRIDKDEFED